MTSPVALIDYDPLKYAAASMCEHYDKEMEIWHIKPVNHMYHFLNSMVKKCIKRCETDQFQCFITPVSSKDNFRFEIYPEYKGNRKDKRKPHHLLEAHQYGLSRWRAIPSKGEEADDTLSIAHYEYNSFGFADPNIITSVICSIDKDFDNCAGWHYNPKKDEFYFVSEIQALRNFYLQVLTGDTADNVPRVDLGWRKAQAQKAIQKAETEKELFDIVYKETYDVLEKKYKDTDVLMHDGLAKDFISRNGQLVWLRRQKNELWEPKI